MSMLQALQNTVLASCQGTETLALVRDKLLLPCEFAASPVRGKLPQPAAARHHQRVKRVSATMHRSCGVRHIDDALRDVKVSHRTHLGKFWMMVVMMMLLMMMLVYRISLQQWSGRGGVFLPRASRKERLV